MGETVRGTAKQSLVVSIDNYLRRTDTVLAKTLQRVSPSGKEYLQSKRKRAFDVIVGGGAALTTLPLLIYYAARTKIAEPSQPIFFWQERNGKNSEVTIVKFRTMLPHSDLDEVSPSEFRGIKPAQNSRVSSLTAERLRQTNLDELPQLWQVVTGKLSLVGARPIHKVIEQDLTAQDEENKRPNPWSEKRYKAWQKARALTPSGLTGLHQLFTPGLKEERYRFHYDTLYARRANLGMDMYLVWRTVAKTIGKFG